MGNMTRDHIRNWFDSWIQRRRDSGIVIEVRAYQFEKLYEMITSPTQSKFVLAAACGAGKTLMSIMYIEYRIFTDSNYRMLVLTHGLSDLREQFIDSAKYYDADFIHGNNVVIDLPHGVKHKNIGHIDEIIVDEAHQFYFTEDGMIESLIRKHKPKREMLLTGSPHQFIFANQAKPGSFVISYIDSFTLWTLGVLPEVHVEVASTACYSFDFKKDFNRNGDLCGDVIITKNMVKDAMCGMLEKIIIRTLSRHKTKAKFYKKFLDIGILENNILTRKSKNDIGKTMISCRNILEAEAVSEYLIDYGYDASQIVQSTADVNAKLSKDDESLIKQFKSNANIKFLIVVYNGILGFDFSELCNVIDLTCSKNVARLWQLYCRLCRKNVCKMDKFYYKIVPYDVVFDFEKIMEGVLHLGHERFLSQFNGRNFYDIPFVYDKHKSTGIKQKKPKEKPTKGKEKPTHTQEISIISNSNVFEMIKLRHTGIAAIDSKCYTTLRNTMEAFDKMPDWTSMTDDMLLQKATDFITKK